MTAKEHIEELQREFWNDAVGGAYSGSQGGAAGEEREEGLMWLRKRALFWVEPVFLFLGRMCGIIRKGYQI